MSNGNTEREAGYRRFTDALRERDYRCVATYGDRENPNNGMRVYVGPRPLTPIVVQRMFTPHGELAGFEAYAPLTTSNKVDDTIRALEPAAPSTTESQLAEVLKIARRYCPVSVQDTITDLLNNLPQSGSASPERRFMVAWEDTPEAPGAFSTLSGSSRRQPR